MVVLREIDGKTTGTKLGMIKSLDEETALVAMQIELDEEDGRRGPGKPALQGLLHRPDSVTIDHLQSRRDNAIRADVPVPHGHRSIRPGDTITAFLDVLTPSITSIGPTNSVWLTV